MTRQGRLASVLAMNVALLGVLTVVGITAHSVGVFAEGADYLADAAGIVVALVAFRAGNRRPGALALAAAINAGWLLVLTLLVIAASVARLVSGVPEVHGLPVLLVSGTAAAVMLAGALVLGGDADDGVGDGDLTMRAVLLDTAADAAAAAGVAVTGAVIAATHGFYWLDPLAALVIALVVGYHAISLLRDVRRRRLQTRSRSDDGAA